MKSLYVCPANISFMPYLSLYDGHRDEESVYFVWDRFGIEIEGKNKIIYRDSKVGHGRNFFDYIRYVFFIYYNLYKLGRLERLVVFGFQLTFFISPFLAFTKIRYAIDIRDYHSLSKLIPHYIYTKADFVALSSPGYSTCVGDKVNSVISHNLVAFKNDCGKLNFNGAINISCIGSIRDIEENSFFIRALANINKYSLSFHGEGSAVNDLISLVEEEQVENVFFSGRYKKENEYLLYKSANMINVLISPKNFNNRVLLANRLYNSAMYKRPILCFDGSVMSEFVKEYSLGLCVDEGSDLKNRISEYFNNFSWDQFAFNCDRFVGDVVKEQELFYDALDQFFECGGS